VVEVPVASLGKLGIGSWLDEIIGVIENWLLISIHRRGIVKLLILWEASVGVGYVDGM
jgi:hypothetical protein